MRTPEDLKNHPCLYKLRINEKGVPGSKPGMQRVRKTVQKLDANGNPLYHIVKVPVKKGCGCNGQPKTEELVEKRVPVTEEVWIDVPTNSDDSTTVICKLFGTVKFSHCQNCKSYKSAN